MKARAGLTLIEVVVVLAILAVVMAFLWSAVQMARETASRVQCANNLKQIGLACHAYHDAVGSLPPGYRAHCHLNALATSPGWGWAAYLLPHLEQQTLFQHIDLRLPIENPVNTARETRLPVYLCPSDPGVPPLFAITDSSGNTLTQAAPISYAACLGSGELDEVPGPKEGAMYRNSHIRLADITDGTSSTILIGERAWSHAMAPWAGAIDQAVLLGGPLNPWRTSSLAAYPSANFPLVQANSINNTADSDGALDDFYSQHPGGANILFADGSVHFLHQQINSAVLLALSTRAGGEVVDPSDY
jgi:prepilin-type processing-associated H-X9-DG protein/prepilin-type N-terminal cleavage/methylation domain-containing protein